ncbi:MAG: lysine--tRNA ligase [Euryarchaeota archaeon]|nr:lysine--tRNA ligase [Euryarchaeota archaeon]
MHWADFEAKNLSKPGKDGERQSIVIAAGITPSGEFHVGHLREILTCEMIYRACRNWSWTDGERYVEIEQLLSELGMTIQQWEEKIQNERAKNEIVLEFIFIVDSADPLRKVYPFLDESYERFIGHQLGNIPPPDANGAPDYSRYDEGRGDSYADHFLSPFVEALKKIGVRPRIVDNLSCYDNGEFVECIDIACKNTDKIREIISNVSGRDLPEDWFPFNPVGSDGSMDGVTVTGYDYPYVSWTDSLGVDGRSDIRLGQGKLPWRIEWPAKWKIHGVTYEPYGKDHGAAGGSYDTGKEIANLFDILAPQGLTYEWISLKGAGAMSSSIGNTIGPMDVLEIVPPEIVRYLIARSPPKRHIDFDTGSALIELADEYQRNCKELIDGQPEDFTKLSKRQQKAWVVKINQIAYSQVYDITFGGFSGEGWEDEVADAASDTHVVSFRHLALLAQLYPDDTDIWKSLKRSGMIDSSFDLLMELGGQNIASEYFIENGIVHSRDGFDYVQYMSSDVKINTEITEKQDWDISLEEAAWHHYSSGKNMGKTSTLPRRLKTIRNWLESPHFPEDFRLRIQTEISSGAIQNIDSRDLEYLEALHRTLQTIDWDSHHINDCICEQAKIRQIVLRDAFQLLYWIVLDQNFGPKLANILAEMSRNDVLNLLQTAIDELSS